MVSKLIKIGNSQGIMLPKKLIEEAGITGQVDIQLEKNLIIIKAIDNQPRAGWDKSFQKAKETENDNIMDFNNSFDNEEWEWK